MLNQEHVMRPRRRSFFFLTLRWSIFCCLLSASAILSADSLAFGGFTWTVPQAADWNVDRTEGTPILKLLVGREPPTSLPRRPMQFAVMEPMSFGSMSIEADVMPLGRSVILVYAYRDSAHFGYAHLSTDTGVQQPRHNGIFRVAGGERERISSAEGSAAFARNKEWYHVSLQHDGRTGAVSVKVNGVAIPALQATDPGALTGKVGVGSFDETGNFRNIRVLGSFAQNSSE